ncbi:MAG: hypothetical protein JO053_13140 [Acidobacteria bacterium]|nr:hypothetical protein [Acidobacteriota bacterium]
MAKLPSMQFYPADWRKDPNVQAMGYFERGVWFEMLCLMFESEQRGKLVLNGKPMPDNAIAQLLGLDKGRFKQCLTTFLEYGVASRDEAGALFNRRMVRDEALRQVRAECGSMGGNPKLLDKGGGLVKQNGSKKKMEDKQNSTPSSSLSSSTSFQRLIDCVHACVSDPLNAGKDARLVEVAVIETWLKWKESPTARPIKSVRYFDEEIGMKVKTSSTLSDTVIDVMLRRRRQQGGLVDAAASAAGPSGG